MTDDEWSPFLDNGERLLWQGRPDPRLQLILSDLDLFLVPVASVLLALMLNAVVSGISDPDGSRLFFAAILCWLVFGRALLDRHKRRRARYAVTDRHILIADAKTGRLRTRLPITGDLSVTLIRGAFPSIRFTKPSRPFRPVLGIYDTSGTFADSLVWEAVLLGRITRDVEFLNVPNGERLATLIRTARAAMSRADATERTAPLGN